MKYSQELKRMALPLRYLKEYVEIINYGKFLGERKRGIGGWWYCDFFLGGGGGGWRPCLQSMAINAYRGQAAELNLKI